MAFPLLFKLEKQRVYSFDNQTELDDFVNDVLQQKEFEIGMTDGTKYFKKYSRTINDEDGDNINSYRNYHMIEVKRKEEFKNWMSFNNTYLLMFENKDERNELFYYKFLK